MKSNADLKLEHLLGELLHLAASLGIKIRQEALGDEETPAESGLVFLDGEPILFLDRRISSADAVEVTARELSRFSLEDIYVKPAVRYLLRDQRRDWED
jgi:hypothetical protein